MNRLLRLLVTLSFSFFIATMGCSSRKDVASPPEIVRGIPVAQVATREIPDSVEAVGTVTANQRAILSSEIVATVRSVNVLEGQRVRRGEVLIVLDDAQQRATEDRAVAGVAAAQQEVAVADSDLGLAKSTLDRYQAMYEKKSVSPHEMDEVQARYKAAEARRGAADANRSQAAAVRAQAQTMLGYTRIRAPFDGVISAKNVDPGALASPGEPLVTVEDTHSFRLEATVDESDLKFVTLAEQVPVSLDAFDGALQAKVVQIVPAADPASRSFTIKLQLPNDLRLRSGQFGRVRFPRALHQAIVVPRTALLDRGQLQGVYLVRSDGVIDLRYVTVGKAIDQGIEVLSGLSGGERLVIAPDGRDLAGKKLAE